jgi:hypothetical protein
MVSFISSCTFRAAICFHVITELRGSNNISQLPPIKLSPTPNFPVLYQDIGVGVTRIRALMVVIVKDAGSRSEGVTRGQPSDDARRSDGSLYVRVLEIEHTVNEILGDVLAKMNQ